MKCELETSWVWMNRISKDEWVEVQLEVRWEVEGGKELSELRVSMKYLGPFRFLNIFLTLLSSHYFLKSLTLFFKLMILFWKSSNSSGSVSSEVKIADAGNLDKSRWNWIEDENLVTKLEHGSKDGE